MRYNFGMKIIFDRFVPKCYRHLQFWGVVGVWPGRTDGERNWASVAAKTAFDVAPDDLSRRRVEEVCRQVGLRDSK